ncbi:hypothetical protein [Streptomyces sp. CLCI03]
MSHDGARLISSCIHCKRPVAEFAHPLTGLPQPPVHCTVPGEPIDCPE